MNISSSAILSFILFSKLERSAIAIKNFDIPSELEYDANTGSIKQINLNFKELVIEYNNFSSVEEDLNIDIKANINETEKLLKNKSINIDNNGTIDLDAIRIEIAGDKNKSFDIDIFNPSESEDTKETEISIEVDISHPDIDEIKESNNINIIINDVSDSAPNLNTYVEENGGHITNDEEYFSLRVDDEETEDGGSNVVSGEIAVGTTETELKLDDVDYISVDWEHKSTSSETQDRSYIGVDKDIDEIIRTNAEDSDIEEYILNSNTNFSRRTDKLDVSNLTGEYNIGVGSQCSSGNSQFVELDLYQIKGVDDNDEKVFEL